MGGAPRFDFSWPGFDENDPTSGRDWLRIEGDHAEGHIFIHVGDGSGLTTVRQQGPKKRKNMTREHQRPDRRLGCLEDYTQ